MADYKYDILFFQVDDGEEKQVYLFNGPHSFDESSEITRFFDAEVEHLEKKDNEPNRVRLKFKISRRSSPLGGVSGAR